MLNAFLKYIRRSALSQEERYLSKSTDMADFERRQRMIDRNQAPFQRMNQSKLFSNRY